ncbi:hypothetical protein F511_18999 [Dorcoceras hygrometricum]|uniref:Uncharacterized protein n=1 Tax=Dorcoceras hygrometricum TaxID=472368 RepID=A0A2Z7D8F3_9LAMI|nr:hypothetical protein F511_18999 [Dorcoceras hygrometricum]
MCCILLCHQCCICSVLLDLVELFPGCCSIRGRNVGEPRRIRITPPGEAAEEQNYRKTINTIQLQITIYDIHRAFRFLPCWQLVPDSDQFLEETGTSRPDKIGTDGFSSSSWPEQIPATRSGGGGGGGLFREEGGGGFSSRDTASRGPTTIVAPESQFRTFPSDHDPKENLRHFVDGLKPVLRHDAILTEPKDFRGAVDKALRADQDWKAIEEERQLKWQDFQ